MYTSTTTPSKRPTTPYLRLLVVRIAPALLRLCRASRCVVSPLDFSSVARTGSRRAFGHCASRCDYSSSALHRLYCAYAVHPDAPSRHSTSRQSVALAPAVCPVIPLCVVTTRLVAATDILRLRRASGCLGTSRDSSRGLSRRLVVDYFASAARPSASARRAARHAARRAARCRLLRLTQARRRLLRLRTRVRVPRHVAQLVTRLVAPLVVDYSASRRLVVDYFASARASGYLGMSRGSSRGSSRRSSSTTPPRVGSSSTNLPPPRVRVPRHVARLIACRRLLRLRRATGSLGSSRGSSRGSLHRSSSTTSPTKRVRVPRHVAQPVTRLIVDYSVHRDFVLRPRWLYSATPCVVTTCLATTLALLRVRRAPPRRRLPVASRRPFISTS
jgi:hypothetical protein